MYHLVTTSDEATWHKDKKLLFLGTWCQHYNRRDCWLELSYQIAPPFGQELSVENSSYSYLRELNNTLLIEIGVALNSYHNVQHSFRYWHIILGHWLKRFSSVCYNRYKLIENVLEEYEITSTSVYRYQSYPLVTPDSLSFISAFNNDKWNNILLYKIIKFFEVEIEIDWVEEEVKDDEFTTSISFPSPNQNLLNTLLKSLFRSVLQKVYSDKEPFIINSYLPRRFELALQAVLGIFPKIWVTPDVKTGPFKKNRTDFSIPGEKYDGFEKFVRLMISELLPTCFLENYKSLMTQAINLPWPKKPKFIFTSNNFDTDELFKLWAADKVEKDVPYLTGQHGNYQAVKRSIEWPEVICADAFFTWGWKRNEKCIPAFNFKSVGGGRKYLFDKNGGLLLIQITAPYWEGPVDYYFKYDRYQNYQYEFYEELEHEIQKSTLVRLHSQARNLQWYEDQRWTDRFPGIKLEYGDAKIKHLISKSRLVVHSYDSTGLLETLTLNIPTLCFWPSEFDHLLDEFIPDYEILKKGKIFFPNPKEISQHINEIWSDIDSWWLNKQTQDARKAFCKKFSRNTNKPLIELRRLLLDTSTGIVKKRTLGEN